MMKVFQKMLVVALPIILWVTLVNSAAALGLMPGKVVVEGNPGETIERTINVINPTEKPEKYDFVPMSYILREDGNQTFLAPEDPKPPYSAESWVKIGATLPLSVPANDQIEVTMGFDIPADASPGTHLAAVSLTKHVPTTDTGEPVGVGVSGRVFLLVEVNVLGDVNASLELEEFFADEELLKNGVLSFVAKFTNEGNIAIAPMGNITIYDENDEQVENIIRITEEVGEETITKGFKDVVPFNPSLSSAYPNISKEIKTKVGGLNIKPGKYKAKLAAYYAVNGETTNFEEEAEFEITEEVIIENFSTSSFHSSLPVEFEGNLINNSSNLISGSATIEIKNAFGMPKETVNLYPDGYKLLPAGSMNLGERAVWDSGLALGYYSADLTFTFNDGASSTTQSIAFWVISWWQLIIIVIILGLVIFGIYKGASKYAKMKKKLEKMEE
ncbi:hypothetical protein ACFL3C_02690 [Patescibacteria group bacterium]